MINKKVTLFVLDVKKPINRKLDVKIVLGEAHRRGRLSCIPIQRIERVAGEACTRAETEAHCELANNETKLPKSEQRSISRFARKLSDFPNCARPRWQVP